MAVPCHDWYKDEEEMSQSAAPTRVDLLDALNRLFDEEELQTLCFKLSVDYDNLRGEGKAGKARELVELAERTNRLDDLVNAVRQERPSFGTSYSYERVQELQASILASAKSDVRDSFVEFMQQIEAYLNEFNLLHKQLQEWKEVHNILQDIQTTFAPCRSYIFAFSRLEGTGRAVQKQREKMLYEVEVEWRPCKRSLIKLQELAANVHFISSPYQPGAVSGPDWLRQPAAEATEVDKALLDSNVAALTDHLSAFGDRVDQFLYLADKSLRDVVGQINQLPRPSVYKVRQR